VNRVPQILLGLFISVVVVVNVHEPGVDPRLQPHAPRHGRKEAVATNGERPLPIPTARVQSATPNQVLSIQTQQTADKKRDRLERLILQFYDHEPLDRMVDDLTALYPGLFRWDHVEGEDSTFRKYQIAFSFRQTIQSFVLDDYEALTAPSPDQ